MSNSKSICLFRTPGTPTWKRRQLVPIGEIEFDQTSESDGRIWWCSNPLSKFVKIGFSPTYYENAGILTISMISLCAFLCRSLRVWKSSHGDSAVLASLKSAEQVRKSSYITARLSFSPLFFSYSPSLSTESTTVCFLPFGFCSGLSSCRASWKALAHAADKLVW